MAICKAMCSTRSRYSPSGVLLGIVALTVLYSSKISSLVVHVWVLERRTRTLSRPGHLLIFIYRWHRRKYFEPHRSTAIPCLRRLPTRNFRKIILRRARVVDLLCRDIVDGRAGRDLHDIGGVGGLVAADVSVGRVLDALFGVGVLGAACRGPVFVVARFPIDDEFRESV